MIILVLYVGIAIAIAAVGLGVGMLIAGRISNWLNGDEEPDER